MTIKAAGILFLDPDGSALFLKRGPGGDWPGAWCFPGGRIEDGETAEEAALREAREELGSVPAGERALLARRCATDPVAIPGPMPAAAPGAATAAATAAAMNAAQPQEVDFTTFLQRVEKQFVPALDGEHVGYAWAPVEQPPEPLHPGCRVVLARLQMDELGVARAIAAGDLTSPQRYKNVTLFALRITGTGVAFRNKKTDAEGKVVREAEFVYRRPENYLTADFLARCNGLPVVMMHPAKQVLDSREFAMRVVGTIMLPYLAGDEVWGIAKVYDDDAVKLLETMPLSTSPGVILGGGDQRLVMEDGSPLLIEGKPALLDHLAICERGVWDKGGEPSGVSATRGDSEMTDAEKKALAEAEAAKAKADAAVGEKLDKLLGHMDGLGRRMDAIEERDKASDKARKDAEEAERRKADDDAARGRFSMRKDDDDDDSYRRRHDAEEGEVKKGFVEKGEPEPVAADRAKRARKDAETEDEKRCADAKRKADEAAKAKADANAALSGVTAEKVLEMEKMIAALSAQPSEADRDALTKAQARADAVYAQFGQQAPQALRGETLADYNRRLTRGLQQHSQRWKDVPVAALNDAAFAPIQDQIYADAVAAAEHPANMPDGGLLMITKQIGGHTINEFRGQPSWMDEFAGHIQLKAKGDWRTPNQGSRH